ncbi:MAG: DUF1127 domain-containing protein [Alphaproteobacteria bacterium]|nr:DUF1127 domain-containing protein [Alphaproteobacteria bacterium]
MNLFKPLRRWNRYRNTRFELTSKTDRELHDMGIARDEISALARAAAKKSIF